MVAKWKAIKPRPFHSEAMSKALRMEMKEWGEGEAIPEFDKVTEGWQGERPYWIQIYRAGGTWLQNLIQPSELDSISAMKWKWLDKGTVGPYPIPKEPFNDPGKRLVFPSIYIAGSTPGSLSTRSASSGGPLRFAREVMHPGIAARGWTEMLVDNLRPSYQEAAQRGMEAAAKASGHGKE